MYSTAYVYYSVLYQRAVFRSHFSQGRGLRGGHWFRVSRGVDPIWGPEIYQLHRVRSLTQLAPNHAPPPFAAVGVMVLNYLTLLTIFNMSTLFAGVGKSSIYVSSLLFPVILDS